MASSSAQSCSFCLLHRFSALCLLCTFDAILHRRRRRFAFDAILCHSTKKKKKKCDGGGDDASDDSIFMVTVVVIEKGIRVWVGQPSLTHPLAAQAISTLPNQYHSIFPDSFPSLHPLPHQNSSLPPLPSPELISAVDIYYKGKPIFSRVHRTETQKGWFLCSPLWIDILEPNETVPTPLKFAKTEDDHDWLTHVEDNLELSWILIDPKLKLAANLSSQRAVSARRHWLTGSISASSPPSQSTTTWAVRTFSDPSSLRRSAAELIADRSPSLRPSALLSFELVPPPCTTLRSNRPSYTRCLLPYRGTPALPLKRHHLPCLRFGMHNFSGLEALAWSELILYAELVGFSLVLLWN
ncbi:hypothetical protein PIB30_094126 [Stylosanthes scabra]|uniref:Uncharacterized protein n=1 Tax=Stylosanthes scabra TaxID=79078 RepID=A0ABU6QUP8_9FABA|nr:hypothetical protein [Stylosanthes scabra]